MNSDNPDTDLFWMQRALELARQAGQRGEVPVGAVVVMGEECIGTGWNQPIAAHDPAAHAEIVALRAAGQHLQNYRLPGAVLYTTLEPCAMCAGAIIHARPDRLVYAATDPKSGAVESCMQLLAADFLNHRVQVTSGILAGESRALLQDFFRNKRQK